MGCLNKHLKNAGALIGVFADADKTVVEKAIQAVLSLSDFSNCHDAESLRSRIPLPKNEQIKNKVEAIRDKLAHVEALAKASKYKKGLELTKMLVEQAKAVKYRPVQAEVLYWLGYLYDKKADYESAKKDPLRKQCFWQKNQVIVK